MEKKFKLLPPSMPNFVAIEMPPKPREVGLTNTSISITDFTLNEAEEYGELMKQAFINHYKEKREELDRKVESSIDFLKR